MGRTTGLVDAKKVMSATVSFLLGWKYTTAVAGLLLAATYTALQKEFHPGWSGRDWYHLFSWPGGVSVWALILTLAAVAEQAVETRKAAEAALKQANHMVASERPFIMVENRGEKGVEFWVRNCGKSPAQILFLANDLTVHYPEWVQSQQQFALPFPPIYGGNYEDDSWEQINLQWIAPGDERRFASFHPESLKELPETFRAELNAAHRVVRIYSSVKYRGMFSSDIYHSRFCYGWSLKNGTYMTGPYSYNRYT